MKRKENQTNLCIEALHLLCKRKETGFNGASLGDVIRVLILSKQEILDLDENALHHTSKYVDILEYFGFAVTLIKETLPDEDDAPFCTFEDLTCGKRNLEEPARKQLYAALGGHREITFMWKTAWNIAQNFFLRFRTICHIPPSDFFAPKNRKNNRKQNNPYLNNDG